MATKEYLISDGPILTEGGVLYRTQIVCSCFYCRRRTLTGLLSSLTVYWREHWPRRLPRTEWRWIMIQSGNVLYTYTERFAWVSVLMTRRVFAESVFAESVLLSQLFADAARIVVDRQFLMWTLTAAVAEGPRDAESWFRAETYYIRILNVSSESVFSMTRRVLPSQFFAESVFAESVICWRGALMRSQFCWASFCWSDIAESDKVRYCWQFTCVCMRKERNMLQSFIVSCLRTIIYVTHQFMHDYIVKSGIASKIAQKATHIDTFTSEYTIACAIETTDNTL